MELPPRHLILLIHGILTGRTSQSWPKHFTGYTGPLPGVVTDAIYYETGPFPIWNNVVKNPRLARELVSRIEARHHYDAGQKIHIVAHSNGGVIAMHTMRRLAALGIRTETAILTGAAINSDVDRSGLSTLIADGWLGRAIAYSSPDDAVTRGSLEWVPGFYGALGSKGFRRAGKAIGLQVIGRQPLSQGVEWGSDRHKFITRTFPSWGHGEYFDADEIEATFACMLDDLGIIREGSGGVGE
jgi:pimeloyl-ACP methyl ester carboxylesterase